MTEREKIEREIILDILAESSKWRISEEDQTDDCIRLEVMDRARRLLLGTETVDANGYAQSHPEVEVARMNEHLASVEKVMKARSKWERDRIRVNIDGKLVWKPRAQCVRQPRDTSKGGAPWKWVWINPQDKQGQCDVMWAEHEQSK